MRRYSIWGREYCADHDVELAQCDANPQAVLDGFAKKKLTIRHTVFERGPRRSTVAKFTYLRIVDNAASRDRG